MTMLLVLVIFGLVSLVIWLVSRSARPSTDPAMTLMQQQIEALRTQVADSLTNSARLLEKQMQNSSQATNQRLDNAAKLFGDISKQLGEITQAHKQVENMMKDVSSLQDILRPPKLRGGMGEVLLENLLREILPGEHYEIQYRFKTGNIVDAIIRLKEGIVPVDAKFPLENFRRMLEAPDETARKAARKEFSRDVRKHIDDIHSRYILPAEGTFPFALMYIPAENVYYETIIKADHDEGDKALYQYAIAEQVMPVSPNSFYAYLVTLAQGFRGMRIEQQAVEILEHLNRLRVDLERFNDEFQTVGKHLNNAQARYAEAEKHLGRFEDKLNAASGHSAGAPDTLISPEAPKLSEPARPAEQKRLL